MPSSIVILNLGGVGHLPVIIDDGGEVLKDALAWFVMEKRDMQKSSSTLHGYATALSQFADYWKLHQSQKSPLPIFTGFFEALVHGNPQLGWSAGISTDTARRYVDTVGLFMDWFTEETGQENPNPKVEQAMSWGARLNEYRRRYKNDMLFHLLPSTKVSRTWRVRKYIPYKRAQRGASPKSGRPDKKFSLEDYLILIQHEKNPRNLLEWLLLGAGGLRVSEPLHLFTSDITFDSPSGDARILLADPTYGTIRVPGSGKAVEKITRQEYLKEQFGRIPRDQFADNHIGFAGWKGMKWHDPVAKTADVIWLHPYFGQLFWKTHQEYLSLRGTSRPQHPWYFVNFKANVGEPLSISNLKAVFADTCSRLNLLSPHNPHALRHLYIDTLVNVFGLSLHQAQILARHRSPESTAIYASAAADATRLALRGLAGKLQCFPGAEKFLTP